MNAESIKHIILYDDNNLFDDLTKTSTSNTRNLALYHRRFLGVSSRNLLQNDYFYRRNPKTHHY